MAVNLSTSNLKIGSKHFQAFTPKVWVTDLNCLVPIDEYLKELSCRDIFGSGGGSNTSDPYLAPLKTTNTGAENVALINAVLDSNPTAATKIVKIPVGVFDVGKIDINYDNVILLGSGMPDINSTKDALIGGTVLKGDGVNVSNRYNVTIRDIGIDVSGTSGGNAISSGASMPGVQSMKIFNVSVLGNMGGHGVELTSGDYNTIRNFRAWNFNHPFALRCSWSTVDGFYSFAKNDTSTNDPNLKWTAASGGIIKSVDDGGFINAAHNIVTNGIIESEELGSGRGVIFDAFTDGTFCMYNIVSNITTHNVSFGVSFGGLGTCSHNSISNSTLFRCTQNAVLFEDEANQNSCSSVRAHLTNDYTFKNAGSGTQNDLFNCHSVGPGVLNVDGTFRTSEVFN